MRSHRGQPNLLLDVDELAELGSRIAATGGARGRETVMVRLWWSRSRCSFHAHWNYSRRFSRTALTCIRLSGKDGTAGVHP
jgi:hypothetical protein